ncbi:pyrimidine 5'-nucleotidase [Sphingomicrobium aestuariivivum]|uniref:pyrimidine 5'-nucleotidase n=1 Tax=Sphingomicrobium aestuariivivum TaxID=1582356 RepID=UPI001FD6414E|nr:pyrimidine 5'-nucleotidase [Sphingomicrobium aestuariivivum]MCJ8191013.1 pyrimidine 5'-nucleotidase [Sphingomicrobium aestuariivivum]
MDPRLSHVRDWIFDLDNTLYPASSGLFRHVDRRMTAYIARLLEVDHDEAYRIQKGYFHGHGTTLAGLMAEHGVDPHHFLEDVHDIPLEDLTPDPRIVEGIAGLPGRAFIYTNGDAPYATRVLERLGLHSHFVHVHDIHATAYRPKPERHGYELLLGQFDIDPAAAVMVEDMAKNLKPAKELGLTTVWVDNGSEQAQEAPETAHVDIAIGDVGVWLQSLRQGEQG